MDNPFLWLIGFAVVGLVYVYWMRSRRKPIDGALEKNPTPGSLQPGSQNQESSRHPRPGTTDYSGNPNLGRPPFEKEIELVKTMIQNLDQTCSSMQRELGELSHLVRTRMPAQDQFYQNRQNAITTGTDVTSRFVSTPSDRFNAPIGATAAYRKLSFEGLRDLPVEPFFVVLDMESSARGSAIGETKRRFNQSESKQSAFVVFAEGEKEGWIFPNPRISFTEAMKYVFPDLNYENFEEAKDRVEPQRVRSVSEGAWETVATSQN